MRIDPVRGHLELLLLAILATGSLHGYAIIQELRRRSSGHFELAEGTVYPALQRLERNGLVSSAWSEASGRKRRIYQLTKKGRRALEQERSAWAVFSQRMSAVLGEST